MEEGRGWNQSGLSVPNRTVPYIRPHDSLRLAFETIKSEPYMPPARYGTIYFASEILRFGSACGSTAFHLFDRQLEPYRIEHSHGKFGWVRLEYYSNRPLWSASIGTPIRFGSRPEIPSGEAIRLENARYGSVRFEDVWYG